VANESRASSLASIFWIVNTVARLILLYWEGPVQYRLRILLRSLVVSTILIVFLQALGYLQFVSYAGVITSGAALSAMYALFFSIAQDFGYGLSPSNTANFAMSASLGEGLLVMPVGYAMGYFGYKALIVIIFLMSAVMYGLFEYAVWSMTKDSEEQKGRMFIALEEKTPKDAIRGTPSGHLF
jgi:ABC-type maltose transport system permease subunit